MPGRRQLMGEILVALNYVSVEQINEARVSQMQGVEKLIGQCLKELGYIDDSQVKRALAIQNLD